MEHILEVMLHINLYTVASWAWCPTFDDHHPGGRSSLGFDNFSDELNFFDDMFDVFFNDTLGVFLIDALDVY